LENFEPLELIKTTSKQYVGIAPSGEIIRFINADKFCRENSQYDFDVEAIYNCARGLFNHHRGWRFFHEDDYISFNGVIPNPIDKRSSSYVGISPSGEIHEFTNAKKFCRDNPEWKLNPGHISNCARGLYKHHKRWKFYYADDYYASQVS
jgi:hypothetical protein